MGVTINISFKEVEKDINKNIKNGVNEALSFLKEYAKKESPIDTGEYNDNHKIIKASDFGKLVVGTLYNDTSYAKILEY